VRALRADYSGARHARRKHDHVSVRYYLWARDGPWRIPEKLHQGLITRRIAFPDLAGTAQKILEVFASSIGRGTFLLRGRGSIYHFDEQGFVDLSAYAEAVDAVRAFRSSRTPNENLFDLTSALHGKHFSRANLWTPSRIMLNRIRTDFQPRPGDTNASKIRVLKITSNYSTIDSPDASRAPRRSGRQNRRSPR
jgi:hypothetical protein